MKDATILKKIKELNKLAIKSSDLKMSQAAAIIGCAIYAVENREFAYCSKFIYDATNLMVEMAASSESVADGLDEAIKILDEAKVN